MSEHMTHCMVVFAVFGCVYLSWWIDRLRGRIKRLEDKFK